MPLYYSFVNYKNGGNTFPPVTLPIGRFLLAVCSTSLPALLISGGNLFRIPPNSPKSFDALIVGTSPNASPTVAPLIWSIVKFFQVLKFNVIGTFTAESVAPYE